MASDVILGWHSPSHLCCTPCAVNMWDEFCRRTRCDVLGTEKTPGLWCACLNFFRENDGQYMSHDPWWSHLKFFGFSAPNGPGLFVWLGMWGYACPQYDPSAPDLRCLEQRSVWPPWQHLQTIYHYLVGALFNQLKNIPVISCHFCKSCQLL